MQLCLTVICWAQRWVEERGARQVLLGVSAKWPSTCQYQVSGREGEGERACMCDISAESKRDETAAAEWKGRTLWFLKFLKKKNHITPISYALKMHLQFSWHHLTFPVKGRSSKLVCLTIRSRVFFWVAHECTHCSTISSGCHDSFEGNFF